jgi:hypothetical protein
MLFINFNNVVFEFTTVEKIFLLSSKRKKKQEEPKSAEKDPSATLSRQQFQ